MKHSKPLICGKNRATDSLFLRALELKRRQSHPILIFKVLSKDMGGVTFHLLMVTCGRRKVLEPFRVNEFSLQGYAIIRSMERRDRRTFFLEINSR